MADLNFLDAITHYLSWRVRLRGFLEDKDNVSESEIGSHKDCDFGKWLYSEGLSRYGKMREISEVEEIHKQLHETALRIVRLGGQRDTMAASQALTTFELLSLKMISLLVTLQQTIG
jgi:methyl-accepting chemotaxis protein